MNKRQEQKLKTKMHIIETAIKIFGKDGLTTARTSDIAKAAGVSHGTVFSHFPKRESLLEETIEEFGFRLSERLHQLVEKNYSIEEILKAHITGIGEYEDFYIRLISEMPLLHENAKNIIIMIQSTISIHLIDVATKDMESSKIIAMPMNMMFNTWLGLLNYYLMNKELFSPEESVIDRYGDILIEHYMKLISYKKEVN
jgi:AcrR family transcriptional regulator